MLIRKIAISNANRRLAALLLFISSITFHTFVSADIKLDTAQEYRNMGYAEHQKGNLNDALNHYTKALALGLETGEVLNDLGVLYEELGLTARAEQYYQKAISADRTYLPAYTNLAYIYLMLGNRQEAFKNFKIRYEMAEPGDPWAEKALEEILKIYPQYKEHAVKLEAERLNHQIVEEARAAFNDRIAKSNEHFRRGQQLAREEKFESAIVEFDRALFLSPDNPKYIRARKAAVMEITTKQVKKYSDRAIDMLNSGDSRSAKYEIQRMLTTIPDDPYSNSN